MGQRAARGEALGSLADREAARVSRRAMEAGHGGGVGGGRSVREGDGILVFDKEESEDKPRLEPLLESPSGSISALAAAGDKADEVPQSSS